MKGLKRERERERERVREREKEREAGICDKRNQMKISSNKKISDEGKNEDAASGDFKRKKNLKPKFHGAFFYHASNIHCRKKY